MTFGIQWVWSERGKASEMLRTMSHSKDLSCLAIKQTMMSSAKKKPHLWGIHKADAKNSLTALLISISYLGPALQGNTSCQKYNAMCAFVLFQHGGRREAISGNCKSQKHK